MSATLSGNATSAAPHRRRGGSGWHRPSGGRRAPANARTGNVRAVRQETVTRRGSRLARRLLLMQLVTVLLTVGGVAVVGIWGLNRVEHDAAGRLTAAIAQSVAADPQVVAGVQAPGADLQVLAERVRTASGTTFVVIMSPEGLRYSHPEPDRIGQTYVGSIEQARSGAVYTEYFLGTLGPSVRTIAPIRATGPGSPVVGLVSVGVLETRISALTWRELPWIALVAGAAMVLGAMLAWLVARSVRRQTLGLEPDEIAAAYTHHDAVLRAVREGLMVLDADGRVVVVNDEARRLLGFAPDQEVEGRRLRELGVDAALRAVTRQPDDVRDRLALAGERVLLVSRTAAGPRTPPGTRVVTLRDRTELAELLRERDAARESARALSSQAHEFANRMQTVLLLVQLGDVEDALRTGEAALDRISEPTTAVVGAVTDPVLTALLMDKAWSAAERDIAFTVAEDTGPAGAGEECLPLAPDDLVAVVGNLVDNALDAAEGTAGAAVDVQVRRTDRTVTIEVSDTGPGVPSETADAIFAKGFSTKPATPGRPRGIGLALVARISRRLGGTIEVQPRDPGTLFRVTLPLRPEPRPAPPTARYAPASPPPPAATA